MILDSWKEWLKSGDEPTRKLGFLVTTYIGSCDFGNEVLNILTIQKPIYKLIRFCDKDGSNYG